MKLTNHMKSIDQPSSSAKKKDSEKQACHYWRLYRHIAYNLFSLADFHSL